MFFCFSTDVWCAVMYLFCEEVGNFTRKGSYLTFDFLVVQKFF